MRFFQRRLKETLITEIILSALCAMLFYMGILEQNMRICFAVSLLCIAFNIVRLVLDLRRYYLFGRTDMSTYYKTNLTAVLIIAVLTSVFAGFNIEPLYTMLFFPYKFLFLCFGIPKIISALVLNAVFAVVTACVPIFIKKQDTEMQRKKDKLILC